MYYILIVILYFVVHQALSFLQTAICVTLIALVLLSAVPRNEDQASSEEQDGGTEQASNTEQASGIEERPRKKESTV